MRGGTRTPMATPRRGQDYNSSSSTHTPHSLTPGAGGAWGGHSAPGVESECLLPRGVVPCSLALDALDRPTL